MLLVSIVCHIYSKNPASLTLDFCCINMGNVLLEQESCVDVECAVAVLVFNHRIVAELAHWQAILECNDEVLVHNEAQACTDGDVWAVVCNTRLRHILVILCAVLFFAAECHIVVACNHCTVAEDVETERDVLLPKGKTHESPTKLNVVRCHIETLYAVTLHTTHCAVATHTLAVVC